MTRLRTFVAGAGVVGLIGTGVAVGAPPAAASCGPEVGPCPGQYVDTALCIAGHATNPKHLISSIGPCATHPT